MAIDKAIEYKKRKAFRGGGMDMGNASNQAQSASMAGGTKSGKSGKSGNTGTGNRPNPHTSSGYSKTTTVSGDRMRSSARETQQAINNARAIEDARKAKREETLKNTTKFGYAKPKSKLGGLGSLIMSGLGMLMGIPGLGLLTGGFGKLKEGLGSLNDKIQSTDFARSKTLMDYLDAKKYGGIDARNRKADQTMREARGIQTAMDMRPTTLDPREMARVGLQMPTAPMSKPTFSDPFANTVGTTANTINDAVSSNSIPTVNGVPMIDTGSVYQDNLDFFDNLNKGIVKNNEPPMVNTDNVMQGSVLDAKPKKGIMQMISDAIFSPAAAAEISPTIGMENTGLGFSVPTGDVGFNTSGRLGNLSATIDAIEALKGESVNPELNYSGNFGNTNVYGTYSDDVQNIGLNFNNDKGLYGGVEYDAITGEPRFDIGFKRTFANGGLASMFTRRG